MFTDCLFVPLQGLSTDCAPWDQASLQMEEVRIVFCTGEQWLQAVHSSPYSCSPAETGTCSCLIIALSAGTNLKLKSVELLIHDYMLGSGNCICFQLLSHPPASPTPSPYLYSHSQSCTPLLTVPPSSIPPSSLPRTTSMWLCIMELNCSLQVDIDVAG